MHALARPLPMVRCAPPPVSRRSTPWSIQPSRSETVHRLNLNGRGARVASRPRWAVAETQMNLAQFPRVKLCQAPTPLEFLPNLTRALGGPQIWMKRDDLTGMG